MRVRGRWVAGVSTVVVDVCSLAGRSEGETRDVVGIDEGGVCEGILRNFIESQAQTVKCIDTNTSELPEIRSRIFP